ncbi:MAG: TonB-dependent receptor [Gemmatimonadaceae bacterium]
MSRAVIVGLLWLGAASVAASRARAQAGQASSATNAAAATGAPNATAPLQRVISLHVRELALRDALDRVAVLARVRFSYAADVLPLDRPVTYNADSVSVGAVLMTLLDGIAVRPVPSGGEQIVLAPFARVTAALTLPVMAVPLDRVVITGSADGRSTRGLPIALEVIEGRSADEAGYLSMASVLDASVPGLWMWGATPATPLARYGSIRGASSFGVSSPKLYVDGIEVANPLLVTDFDAASLERIEVIRGPQGAALHGADAISGVVNLVTRAEGSGPDAARLRVRSTTGVANTAFAPQDAFWQQYAVALRGGDVARAAQLSATAGTVGDVYPGADAGYVRANGSARWITGNTSLRLTARFLTERVGAGSNPFLSDSALAIGDSAVRNPTVQSEAQSVTQYTLGATLRSAGSERWTHQLVAGVDGYSLSNVTNELTPFPSATDSVLRASSGRADRYSVRASSVARVPFTEQSHGTWTLALEHSALRESGPVPTFRGPGGVVRPVPGIEPVQWLTNTGLAGQGDLAFRDRLFLTAGVRVERSDAYVNGTRYTTLPLVGAAVVTDRGTTTLKWRASYGRGMRAPRTANRLSVQGGLRVLAAATAALATLEPEEQAGVEGGFDLYVGQHFSLQATLFDQRATGLIQQVAVPDTTRLGRRFLTFQYQNVGAIDNRGVELASKAQAGRLALHATLSMTDSRVEQLATRYTGDLREGDRMLGVPRLTTSADIRWNAQRWSMTLGAVRASDWIEYDRVELARAYANFDGEFVRLAGAELRGYWRKYDGATRLRAGITRELWSSTTLVLTGENLLDVQRGEPDNATIVPGRTVLLGVRAAIR